MAWCPVHVWRRRSWGSLTLVEVCLFKVRIHVDLLYITPISFVECVKWTQWHSQSYLRSLNLIVRHVAVCKCYRQTQERTARQVTDVSLPGQTYGILASPAFRLDVRWRWVISYGEQVGADFCREPPILRVSRQSRGVGSPPAERGFEDEDAQRRTSVLGDVPRLAFRSCALLSKYHQTR